MKRNTAAEMLEQVGTKNISTWDNTEHSGERIFSVHDIGITRMGRDT